MTRRRNPRKIKKAVAPAKQPPLEAQIHAGTLAIRNFIQRAQADDANNPVVSAMAVATLNALNSTPDGELRALLVGHLTLAAYMYGKSRHDPAPADQENGQ